MSDELKFEQAQRLLGELSRLLLAERNLSEYLEISLPLIAAALGASGGALIDYHEQTDRFALLHVDRLGSDIYSVQKRFDEKELRRALSSSGPFHPHQAPRELLLPLRFSDVLEAVLFLHSENAIELSEEVLECGQVASRLLGLLMSSSRLAVNRRFHFETTDLKRARDIQLSFLPREFPSSRRCEVYGVNQSSAWVGGDYFDCFLSRPGVLQAVLADACGHGLAAALIMSNFRGLLRAQLQVGLDCSSLFDQLNASVHHDAEFIHYLTGIFLDLDETSGHLRYLNAGHFDPVVVSPGGASRSLPGGGPPLGMFRNSAYAVHETRLEEGEVVVLYTDGLVEMENEEAHQFGQVRIAEVVSRSIHAPLPELAGAVLEQASSFSGRQAAQDDVTLLLLRLVAGKRQSDRE